MNLNYLYNFMDAPSFFSGRCNTGTIPDLAFASAGFDSLQLYRRTPEKFPSSQQRPLIIMAQKTWPK